jgi:hypothetical protein
MGGTRASLGRLVAGHEAAAVPSGALPAVTAALRQHEPPQPSGARRPTGARIGHSFGTIRVSTGSSGARPLHVGSPSDPLEHEADRVATQVMQARPEGPVSFASHDDAAPETVRRTTDSPYSISEGTIVEDE